MLFSPKSPDRLALLAAVPVQNELVQARPLSKDHLRLTAPLKQSRFLRILGSRAREKSFDLDELGAFVWHACNGSNSVEQIIDDFAQSHRVNTRQAEVAVGTFLRTLLAKNLILIATPASTPNPRVARQQKKRRAKSR